MIIDYLDELITVNKAYIILQNTLARNEPYKIKLHRKLERMFHGEIPEERSDPYILSKFIETFPAITDLNKADEFLNELKTYPKLPKDVMEDFEEKLKQVHFKTHEDFVHAKNIPCLMFDRRCT